MSDYVTLCKGIDIWFQDPDRYLDKNIWNNQETDASLWCAKVWWVDSLRLPCPPPVTHFPFVLLSLKTIQCCVGGSHQQI